MHDVVGKVLIYPCFARSRLESCTPIVDSLLIFAQLCPSAGQLFDCWSIVSIASEKLFALAAVSHSQSVPIDWKEHVAILCNSRFSQ